ncbi:MAG: hypothetical protein KDC88_15605, partial [Ignavibacteriae bacterium]|nr:hypothetical protein [Ignavibacteriota bacterium]
MKILIPQAEACGYRNLSKNIMQIIEILKYIEENTNSAFFYTPNIYIEAKCYFFKKPFKVINAKTKAEVENTLAEIDKLSQDPNITGFATIPYEIGYYFQPKEIKKSYLDNTELSFYLYYKDEIEIIDSQNLHFDEIEIIDSQNLHFDEIEKYFNTKNHISNFELDITKKEYVEKITKIKQYITE